MITHKRLMLRPHHGTVDFDAAQWIGTIQYHDGNFGDCTSFHHFRNGSNVAEIAQAGILDINQDQIDTIKIENVRTKSTPPEMLNLGVESWISII